MSPITARNGRVRVFQIATGNVGSEMIRRIRSHPDLELIGLHCYSADKVGRDAGEIVGIGPIGVIATGTVEEIIVARPDCVTFHGVFPDVDLYEQILEAGDQHRHHRRLDHRPPPQREPSAPVGPNRGRGHSGGM